MAVGGGSWGPPLMMGTKVEGLDCATGAAMSDGRLRTGGADVLSFEARGLVGTLDDDKAGGEAGWSPSMPSSGGSQGAESGTADGEVGDDGPIERLREMRLKKPPVAALVTLAVSLSFVAVAIVSVC